MYTLIILALAVAALGLILWLARSARESARRLDRRIEEYHEEGPPADPFSELAKLMADDRDSRPRGKPKRNDTGRES